jgi:hypothetical protein
MFLALSLHVSEAARPVRQEVLGRPHPPPSLLKGQVGGGLHLQDGGGGQADGGGGLHLEIVCILNSAVHACNIDLV